MANKGDLDEGRARDIRDGIEAASSILERSNAAIAHEERKNAVLELQDRVEDWKGHRMEGFGELLLYGTYTVLKGESTSKDAEREVSPLAHICSGSFHRYFNWILRPATSLIVC